MKEKGGFIKISFAEVNNWNKAQSSEIIVAALQHGKALLKWAQCAECQGKLHQASSHKGKAILEVSLLQKLTKILPIAAPSEMWIHTRLSPNEL